MYKVEIDFSAGRNGLQRHTVIRVVDGLCRARHVRRVIGPSADTWALIREVAGVQCDSLEQAADHVDRTLRRHPWFAVFSLLDDPVVA